MSGRNSQITWIYLILMILEGTRHGLTAAQIWEALKDRDHEASKRTIYRDIQALQAAGFPLTTEGEDDELTQRWSLLRTTAITQGFVLSARELLALYLAHVATLSDRRFLRKRDASEVRTHHLHLVVHGGPQWKMCLAFRDYLRSNPWAIQEYAALKATLAERFKSDREAYTDAKKDFVAKILQLAI